MENINVSTIVQTSKKTNSTFPHITSTGACSKQPAAKQQLRQSSQHYPHLHSQFTTTRQISPQQSRPDTKRLTMLPEAKNNSPARRHQKPKNRKPKNQQKRCHQNFGHSTSFWAYGGGIPRGDTCLVFSILLPSMLNLATRWL